MSTAATEARYHTTHTNECEYATQPRCVCQGCKGLRHGKSAPFRLDLWFTTPVEEQENKELIA